MLVVTRRPGEVVRIGDDITVVVTKVHGKDVHIGITAPDGVIIDRGEVSLRRRSTPRSAHLSEEEVATWLRTKGVTSELDIEHFSKMWRGMTKAELNAKRRTARGETS